MSYRSILMEAVAGVQSGIEVEAGERYVRGMEVVVVDAVAKGNVSWTSTADGAKFRRTHEVFVSRALTRLDAPPAPAGSTSQVDAAWAVAGSKSLPHATRLDLMRTVAGDLLAGRTGTDCEIETAKTWAAALTVGNEPIRQCKDCPACGDS